MSTQEVQAKAPSRAWTALLHTGERLDDLVHGGRFIIQHPDSFCFAMDAVLLAHFPRYRARDRVLDLGTGTGVIPLLMAECVAHVDAVELDAAQCDRARRSVAGNGLTDRITVREGDYRGIATLYPRGAFDVVLANPPYYPMGRGKISAHAARVAARHEQTATLADVVAAARYALCDGGHFCMVHVPQRLDEIFATLATARFGVRRLQFVEPRAGKSANLVLLDAVRGAACGAISVLPTLCVYDENGQYTKETLAYYGDDLQSHTETAR